MPKKKQEEWSLDKMLGDLQAGLSNPKPNNLQYEPHEKQVMFHVSSKKGRQFLGGNRSGKTVAGINEDIWWATGRHPYFRDIPVPNIGRIVTVDFKNGANKIIIPNLKQWLAPSDLVNGSWEDSWHGGTHTLVLANGSEIEIMSSDQDLEKFAGVPRHWTHFDEECPKVVWDECKARLVDYNGRWWMTMTPVEGVTWTHAEIFKKRNTPLIEVIEVASWDNPNVSTEGLSSIMEGFSEDEIAIRGQGKYVPISGLVFKTFDSSFHVLTQDGEPYDSSRGLEEVR